MFFFVGGCLSCRQTNGVKALKTQLTLPYLNLPYLTLPFGAGILPPSTEASSGPNAHPRINPKVIETFYRFLQT